MGILSIQSHVAYGHVGNVAATFALQRLGVDVWPVHTVNFATHTGYGPPTGTITAPATIRDIVDRLDREGVLAGCDAVLTGYVGSAEAGEAIVEAVARVRRANSAAVWCCDPVMGDTGRGLFVPGDVAAFFARHAGAADILLPNRFETERLTGIDVASPADAEAAVRALCRGGSGLAVLTGLAGLGGGAPGTICAVAGTEESGWLVESPEVPFPGRPNGAGDLFAAVFLGVWLRDRASDRALAHAVAAVRDAIAATAAAGERELCVVAAQDRLAAPADVPAVSKLW